MVQFACKHRLDYSSLEDVSYDWAYITTYGNVMETIPTDVPPALGKPITHTVHVDANLYHDLLTSSRAVTRIMHIVNGTPVDCYTEVQDTVKTATYSSKFVAARIAMEQIINLLQTMLR